MSEVSQDRSVSHPRRWSGVAASVVTGVLLFAVGLVGGWAAAWQKASPVAAEGHDHGQDDHGHEHGAHAPALSPRTLANLGVEVAELKAGEYVRTRDVPAVVAVRPGSLLPVSTPVAGTIEEVLVVEGQRVDAGAPVARLRREAFPRPALVLTDAVLRPLNEEFHEAIATLRSAADTLAIAREELARVRRVTDASALPGKVEIDLRNEERRALRALENARHEAERHGLTPEEITGVESGTGGPSDLPPAERVLARNALWSEQASAVLATLPEDVRRLPYVAAVLGELVGSRALTPAMADVLRKKPALAASFLDVAGLIQQGWSVESLVALADAGALEPVVTLRAPAGAPDWDVERVRTRPGDRVEAGSAVADCRDLSHVHLELSPAGSDLPAIAAALSQGASVAAEPLVEGSGLPLEGLRLLRIESGEAHAGGGDAIVPVENRAISSTNGTADRVFRSWALRPGLRYLVRVPVERIPNAFVLPADAVASRGPDTVVLLEDGDGFLPVAVRVAHRDARTVAVANDGAVFAGDRVVVRGAYSVLLAIQAAAGGGADPHAGHSH